MVLNADLKTRLLGAIQTDSLIFLCGAGLSMASPSNLPSAIKISQTCYDAWLPTETLDPALRDDIDRLSGHFHARGDFKNIFIRLVPWNELVGPPNNGHAAIADLLISRGAYAALSANVDSMIERWGEERRIAMRGALTGQEAGRFTESSNPLIKFHGCIRNREETLWTQLQIAEAAAQARIKSCSEWMSINLPGRDLVVVGFWTDWGYLNNVLANAFGITNANSVTVIDPSTPADLQAKAPNLWTKLTSLSKMFEHVQASGSDVLDELRTAYSRTWARKFYVLGKTLVQPVAGVEAEAPFDTLEGEDLYNLRRDAEGIPYDRAATLKNPAETSSLAASVHILLLNAGAVQQGAWLQYSGRTIRVVNGAGKGLENVKAQYKEPMTISQPEIVVCAGAVDLGVPARQIPLGRGESTVRPTPGGSADWMTYEQARGILNL